MTLDDLDFLTSSAGEKLLERLRREDLSEANHLTLVTALRKEYALEQVRTAVNLALVRIKAVNKFGADAAKMFFTDEALQQASDPQIRQYRPSIMSPRMIADVCCGIGSDSLAFAQAKFPVSGVDIDPIRVKMAQLNAEVLGLIEYTHFEVGDAHEISSVFGNSAIFYDPARRDDKGNRIYDVERYIPPLSLIRGWRSMLTMVKLSPGIDLTQLRKYQVNGPEGLEFLSVEGDLKEAVLWSGVGFAHAGLDHLRGITATLLKSDEIYHWQRYHEPEIMPLSQPLGWLVEPDPSIIRAGLVQDLAIALGGYLLDETIAYFTTDTKPESVWVRAWQILDWMPFNLKKLRAYLRERNVGIVTVKKRGSALTPEGLTADLKLKGGESRTLVLTRYSGQPIVIICADYGA